MNELLYIINNLSVTAVSRAGGYKLFKLTSNRPGDHLGL